MITAWQIYWVMQLDAIRGVVCGCAAVLAIIAAISLLAGAIFTECGTDSYVQNAESGWRTSKRVALWTAPFSALLALATAFIPSTKTAAAMIVIPAVANNQAIQREAGDLYGIAKDALRELARPKPEKSK